MDLYYNILSPPSRAILLLGEALNVRFNLISLDVHRKDYVNVEFKKINPQHTVPTLVVDGVAICEPGAILGYLYGRTNSRLYPKDPKTRAIVNQRLFFDHGTLCERLEDYYYPLYFEGAPADEAKMAKLEEALGVLNGYLTANPYAAGPNMTLADYSLVATVSSLEAVRYDLGKFPSVAAWYEGCKASIVDYAEINDSGMLQYRAYFESGLGENAA
uniref:glutathione transferase n=1 Tax=Anopheles atroparvus TaxID=41427 RepID=A0AAG5CP96_ANOAO